MSKSASRPDLLTRTLHEGKWLSLKESEHLTKSGQLHLWEKVSRKNCFGIVAVIPWMIHSHRFLMIKQFRVAINQVVLEFPAGLLDKGETYEQAALRELHEETGYQGVFKQLIAPSVSSPGMSDETLAYVLVDIDEKSQDNLNPTTDLEDEEDIEVCPMSMEELKSMITQPSPELKIDAKVSAFVMGLSFS